MIAIEFQASSILSPFQELEVARYLSLIIVVGVVGTSLGQDQGLPKAAKNDQNPADKTIPPQASLARITVPKGFHVSLFAAEPNVAQPIAATFDDRGRLWVAECYSHPVWKPTGQDRIVIFEDRDGDGRFDHRKVFWDKGNYLTGIAFGHGGVWICNTPNLMFIPDRNRDDIPDGEAEVHLNGWVKERNNVLNNLNWGPDGWLYGCIGNARSSWVAKPGTPQKQRTEIRQGVWRYHPIQRKFEPVAHGAVNPWGLDFNDWGDGFFTNCVIGHLWQLVPGAFYVRSAINPLAFVRIAPSSDHLHWGGGDWHSSRGGKGIHNHPGGGHAHTGAMIYLADNWPAKYRNTFITGNIHGNRLNNDILEPKGSGYVGRHGQDFLHGNHDWFRCLWQKYGPDGGVFIGDWHDFGECHDNDGSHRTSGRIYKVFYGSIGKLKPFDLNKKTSRELANLQLHRNEWFVRHARRVLQERHARGLELTGAKEILRRIFDRQPSVPKKLRALWCLHVIGAADEGFLLKQLAHTNDHVRKWAVRLLIDQGTPGRTAIQKMVALAGSERSAKVRLSLASAVQRLPDIDRWNMATALVSHREDIGDHNQPKMIWYGIAQLAEKDTERAMKLLVASRLPLVREQLARVCVASGNLALVQTAEAQRDVVRGIRSAIRGVKNPKTPRGWTTFFARAQQSNDPRLQYESDIVAAWFGQKKSLDRLLETMKQSTTRLRKRVEILQALVDKRAPNLPATLNGLLGDEKMRRFAIRGLAAYADPSTADQILGQYAKYNALEKQEAISTLASRREYAVRLLEAVRDKTVDRRDITAYTARQLHSLGNKQIRTMLAAVWGNIRTGSKERRARIERFKSQLTEDYLKRANVMKGRVIFGQTCGKCHKLFGEGEAIAPDLTGSNRKNLGYVLENVLDPSALVARDYQLWTVVTKQGRLISGLIKEEDKRRVIVRTVEQQVAIPRSDIDVMKRSSVSMMPEGQFDKLSLQQVRDLVGYLRSEKRTN